MPEVPKQSSPTNTNINSNNISDSVLYALNNISEEDFKKGLHNILENCIINPESIIGKYPLQQLLQKSEKDNKKDLLVDILIKNLKAIFPNYIFSDETLKRFKNICIYINSLPTNFSKYFADNNCTSDFDRTFERTLSNNSDEYLSWEELIKIVESGILVDVFSSYNNSKIAKFAQNMVCVDKYNIKNYYNALNPEGKETYIPLDTLCFISLLPDNSVNYTMSGVDSIIIDNSNYIDKLSEEIFRTMKKGGVFFGISGDAGTIGGIIGKKLQRRINPKRHNKYLYQKN